MFVAIKKDSNTFFAGMRRSTKLLMSSLAKSVFGKIVS